MSFLLSHLRKWNLFQKDDDNIIETEDERYSNIIATRVYLITLIFCLISFTVACKLNTYTTKQVLYNPTIQQFTTLPVDAQCPCSRLAISYKKFVTLQAIHHQICSSDFVSERWIKTIYIPSKQGSFHKGDIRFTGTALFQALASLCYLSDKYIQDSLSSFYAGSFISSQVLSQDALEKAIEAYIEQFKLTIFDTFQSRFNLINKMISGNRMMSGLQTDSNTIYNALFKTPASIGTSSVTYTQINGQICDCYDDYNCHIALGIYPLWEESSFSIVAYSEVSIIIRIPGLYIGCMPIHSLLQSSLECLYNQTCINQIIPFLSTNQTFTAMTISAETIFKLNSTIQSMFDLLMIEQWRENISYQLYYDQCAPKHCTYIKTEQYNFMFVLTKVIGFLGTLILVLSLIIPSIIRFLRKKPREENQPTTTIPLKIRLHQLKIHIKYVIVHLNIFETRIQIDHHHTHIQRIGTRIYIFILIVSFIALILYSSITTEFHRVTIQNPTYSQYEDLQNVYSDDLTCPCTLLSVPYKTFIQLQPIYHQICSSYFATSAWIDFLKDVLVLFSMFEFVNEQVDLGTQFGLLSALCNYTNEMIDNALSNFLQREFVSSQVIQQNIFNLEINSIINDWKFSTINQFQQTLQLIRATNQANKLVYIYFNFQNEKTSLYSAVMKPKVYSDCPCDLFDSCHQPTPLGIFAPQDWWYYVSFTIDSFLQGCSPLEGLLQSTLECFYNRSCFDPVYNQLTYGFTSYPSSLTINLLNTTNQLSNETIESILNRLTINQWLTNVSFISYYNACAPSSCIYQYRSRRHIFVIVLTVLSVFGGLSTGFKILTLIFVRLSEKLFRHNYGFNFKQFIKNLFICNNQQKITNRIHLIILLIALSIFYLYYFIPSQLIMIKVTKPSLSDYQNLSKRYSTELECTCSKNSFNYQTFLSIEAYYHPICSSHFVTNKWILYVYNRQNSFLNYNYTDFYRTSVGQFQSLLSLCELSLKTVHNAITQFKATNYIDSQLLSLNVLHERIEAIMNDFKLNTARSFLITLDIIRQITHADKLLSLYWSNWKYHQINASDPRDKLWTDSLIYDECNCALSSRCIQSSRKMMAGCYPLETLLQSTLQCFYDQQCIDASNTFQALNSSFISNYFNINLTIETILQEIMVENYSINLFYEKYFDVCAPSSCTYSYTGREDVIDILTTIIGLYGGLVIISGWLAKLFVKVYLYRKRQIVPHIQ